MTSIIYSAFLTQTTDIEHFLKSLMKSVKDIISRQQSELVRRNKVLKYGRPTYSWNWKITICARTRKWRRLDDVQRWYEVFAWITFNLWWYFQMLQIDGQVFTIIRGQISHDSHVQSTRMVKVLSVLKLTNLKKSDSEICGVI